MFDEHTESFNDSYHYPPEVLMIRFPCCLGANEMLSLSFEELEFLRLSLLIGI